MIVLRDPQQTSQVVQPEIKAILQERFDDICNPQPYTPSHLRCSVALALLRLPRPLKIVSPKF